MATDEQPNWNSPQYFSTLFQQIMLLQLPVPEVNDRVAFVEAVQRAKKVNLLTTAVNMVDFKDDLVLIRDIHFRLSYTLNCEFPRCVLPNSRRGMCRLPWQRP